MSDVDKESEVKPVVVSDKSRTVWVLGVVIVLLFAFVVGSVMYQRGQSDCLVCDLNSTYNSGYVSGYNSGVNYSYDRGFVAGTEHGLNMSVNAFLFYSHNCSVVMVNYSNNIYGFIDITCVKEVK